MVSFPGGLRGGCQPSGWFWFECLIQTAWRAFTELGRAGQLLTNNIPLPHHQSPWETSGWSGSIPDGGKCSITPASPILPVSQSPKTCFGHKMSFFLSELRDWWLQTPASSDGPWCHQGLPVSFVAWCQGSELRSSASQLLNKRKISCDDFHNKPVSINWDSYCSGTEVSPHGQGHHLKRVLISQVIDSSGHW